MLKVILDNMAAMDVFICGVCHEEFNDIMKFVDHKKTLGVYSCSPCSMHFQSEDDFKQHIAKEHKIGHFNPDTIEQNETLMQAYEVPVHSSESNENNITQVGNMTIDDVGNVTFIPHPEGNIALMGNIQIVHSMGNSPAAVAVTPMETEQSGIGTDKTVLAFQSSELHCQTEQGTVFASPLSIQCDYDVSSAENRSFSDGINFIHVRDGKKLDGIFACGLCQCFSLSQEEIIKHIHTHHSEKLFDGNLQFDKLFTRLEPLKGSNTEAVIEESFSTQSSSILKILPVSTNSGNESTDALHLVLETEKRNEAFRNGMAKNQPKRKRGRPRKTESQKTAEVDNQKEDNTDPEVQQPLEPGPDGQYHCPRCKRAFRKERHILGHKCLGKGDYVDFSHKENSLIDNEGNCEANQDVTQESEEEDVDTDITEDFRMYMPIDRPPWSRGGRGSRSRGRGRGRGQGITKQANEEQECTFSKLQGIEGMEGNKENQALITIVIEEADDVSEDAKEDEFEEAEENFINDKPKISWRNDPHHVPVFNTEAERATFEEQVNSVDLSCVDNLYERHEVAQNIDVSRVGKVTGRETSELVVFSCNVCKKVFKSLSHMRLHCLIHTKLKPFKCCHCPYRSNAKGNLYTHMRKHTGNYFKCPHCNFQSRNRSHLAEHKATHSKRRHQCKLCHNYYNTSKSLMNHVRKYHTNSAGRKYFATFLSKTQQLMSLLHICHICNRKFKKKADRDRHLLIHNIHNSPHIFRCSLCDYTASRKTYLENHHQRHRLIFICCLCKCMLISTAHLKSHLQRHLNQNCNNSEPPNGDVLSNATSALPSQSDCNLNVSVIDSATVDNGKEITEERHTDSTKILQSDFEAARIAPCEKNDSYVVIPEGSTIDSLFQTSLNSSWYLPEPDDSIALSQYINLPEELREGQGNTESAPQAEALREEGNNHSTQLNESSEPGHFNPITSLNYKSLTSELYKKIQQTFGNVECPTCGRLFHSQLDLEPHLLIHSESKPFKCLKCPYSASTKENLKRHGENVHEGRTYSCDKCDFVCTSRTTFWNHCQKHIATIKCNICNKKFLTPTILKNHIIAKHPEISSQSELQKFMPNNRRVMGRIGRCSYKCPYCNRVFRRSSADLQKHIWIHEGVKPYKCNLCSHTCRSRNNLNIHMLRHSNEKPHTCEECGRSYKSKTALKCHIKSHAVDGLFLCSQCDYTASQKSHLKRHTETHELLRHYVCEHCSYSANTISHMRVHYSRKHKGQAFIENPDSLVTINVEAQDQAYKCLSCECTFTNVSETKDHLKVQHGISAESVDLSLHKTTQFQTDSELQPTQEDILFGNTDITTVASTEDHIEMVELQDDGLSSTLQELQSTDLPDTGVDENTATTVTLIQQIMEQGASESQVTLHSIDGQSLVAVNPQAFVIQENGQELLLNGTTTDGQYVIQYVTDASEASAETEVTVQTCEEAEMYKNVDNQMEIEYCSTEHTENNTAETGILEHDLTNNAVLLQEGC